MAICLVFMKIIWNTADTAGWGADYWIIENSFGKERAVGKSCEPTGLGGERLCQGGSLHRDLVTCLGREECSSY